MNAKRTLKINLLLFTDSVNVFVDKWVALGSKAIQKLLEVVPEHQEWMKNDNIAAFVFTSYLHYIECVCSKVASLCNSCETVSKQEEEILLVFWQMPDTFLLLSTPRLSSYPPHWWHWKQPCFLYIVRRQKGFKLKAFVCIFLSVYNFS